MNIEISSTHVLTQKYFKDDDLNVFAIDIMSMNIKTWRDEVKEGWIEITKKEAELISNPPLPDEEERENSIRMLEQELNQLKQNLIFAQAMGDDISDIVARVKEVREELEKLK